MNKILEKEGDMNIKVLLTKDEDEYFIATDSFFSGFALQEKAER